MSDIYRHIDACLATSGTEAFALHFLDLAEGTGARQLMVFDLSAKRALCLMSRNYSTARLGEALAESYLDGWFRQDPLLPDLLSLAPGDRRVLSVGADDPAMPADYRARFFTGPGLAGKVTVLVAGQDRRLMVNFYLAPGDSAPDKALAGLAARLLMMHVEGQGPSSSPPALAALSAREQQVCLGVLAGKKTEVVAAELDLSPATVTTYRRRAYAKLGITSGAALFAICRTGS